MKLELKTRPVLLSLSRVSNNAPTVYLDRPVLALELFPVTKGDQGRKGDKGDVGDQGPPVDLATVDSPRFDLLFENGLV
jgi:hypothetical protein